MSHSNKKRKVDDLNSKGSFFLELFITFLKPSNYVKSISDIDVSSLKKQEFKLIICDLDNTLVPHYTKLPTKKAINFVNEIKKHEIEFVIVSNNTKNRTSLFAEKLGVKTYLSNSFKPFTFKLKRFLKKNFPDINPSDIVLIGDMMITDTIAANYLKMESILVQPLIEGDTFSNKILSFFENKVFKKLSKESLIISEQKYKKTLYDSDLDYL